MGEGVVSDVADGRRAREAALAAARLRYVCGGCGRNWPGVTHKRGRVRHVRCVCGETGKVVADATG
jgi:hypothetical protein